MQNVSGWAVVGWRRSDGAGRVAGLGGMQIFIATRFLTLF
jgi:hypothetical protein